jgi:hypothetical protein
MENSFRVSVILPFIGKSTRKHPTLKRVSGYFGGRGWSYWGDIVRIETEIKKAPSNMGDDGAMLELGGSIKPVFMRSVYVGR